MKKLLLLLAGLALSPAILRAQVTERLYLSGHDKDDAVPWKFECTSGENSGYWTTLPVPSQWDMHGFGTLHYHKDLTNAFDEKGLYEHDFTVPKGWAGQRVFLVFEGVMTDTSAKINGQSAGPTHQGSFYRFKYDVTPLVKFGAVNKLEVTVAKHSANASVNRAERNADFWVFGGIFRPVYLEAAPLQFIDRVAIDARADGSFRMDAFVNGGGDADTVEAQIMSVFGDKVGKPFAAKLTGDKTTLTTKINSPRLWTAETPNLYKVEVRLKSGKRVAHRFEQRFGFRTMEVREGDGLYVNGKKVILKGANRHSFWPDSGRTLSEAVHRLDIETLKGMNMNAVRMSHYPPDAQFLDLCDELGVYVLDELAGWHAFYDTETGTKLVHEMLARDVNHPCILFWDNGNEGGFNTDLDPIFGELDPQKRHVLHPWRPFGGVDTSHYLSYEEARQRCAGNTIYMPTEFQHGLFDGGAGAGLEDYWKLMGSSPICAGGFIWVLEDDGVKRPDTGEIDVAGNQAPDGIVGPYRQREGSFYAIKEIWSPIQVTYKTNAFLVENHYSFTDTKQCRFHWELRRFPGPDASRAGYTVTDSGTLTSPEIPPGVGALLPFRYSTGHADALALRVDDPHGRELWTWVWPLHDGSRADKLTSRRDRLVSTHVEDSVDVLTVRKGKWTTIIDKKTGMLGGVQVGTQSYSLANGPRLATSTTWLRSLTHHVDGPDYVVEEKFDGGLRTVTWRIKGNGWLQCDYRYEASGPLDYFGVTFDYPENRVLGKRWLGDGPYRVWKDRLRGPTLGVWENDYNDTIAGWKDWVYPEFKGIFSDVRWLELSTREGPITIAPDSDIPYTQVLTPDFPPINIVGKAYAPVPQAGIAFLHGIPPIGSKFKPAVDMGPQGQTNIANGVYSGSVSFYFGKLP